MNTFVIKIKVAWLLLKLKILCDLPNLTKNEKKNTFYYDVYETKSWIFLGCGVVSEDELCRPSEILESSSSGNRSGAMRVNLQKNGLSPRQITQIDSENVAQTHIAYTYVPNTNTCLRMWNMSRWRSNRIKYKISNLSLAIHISIYEILPTQTDGAGRKL